MTDQVERYGKMIEIFMQKKLWQALNLDVSTRGFATVYTRPLVLK